MKLKKDKEPPLEAHHTCNQEKNRNYIYRKFKFIKMKVIDYFSTMIPVYRETRTETLLLYDKISELEFTNTKRIHLYLEIKRKNL